MIRFVILNLFLQILLFRTGFFPSVVSPATGDPVVVILAVLGVSAVAMIVLAIVSKRGGGRRR